MRSERFGNVQKLPIFRSAIRCVEVSRSTSRRWHGDRTPATLFAMQAIHLAGSLRPGTDVVKQHACIYTYRAMAPSTSSCVTLM